ncbi:MAG: DUF4900 domain-containing protein, partial [Candidatus Eisenbacteria bacterium]|nr:DUF4900 domain-containing protein [Candidatus Eisenbacteria bacterium]
MTQRTRSGETGYALAVATIMAFAVGVIGFSFLAMGGHETKASQKQLDSQRAFWLAEAGRSRALLWMTEQMRPPEAQVTIYQDASGPDGGSYTVHCLVDTAAAYQVEKAFVLDCCGRSRGLERRIRQRIRMTSFARYAYFTHDEVSPGGNPIWYITADVIEGRLHSNGTLRIAGSPRFLGEVTSASDHMIGYPSYWVGDPADWPVGGNDPDFAAGATLAVPEIPLPTETLDLRQEALAGGIHVATETDVEIGVAGDPPVAAPGWLRYRSRTPPGQPWVSASVASLASG